MESSSSSAGMRSPGFIERDDGLASVAAEISGNYYQQQQQQQQYPCQSRGVYSRTCGAILLPKRKGSLRNFNNSVSTTASGSTNTTTNVCSPRSGYRFYVDARFEESHQPHFLEACFLCQKPLGGNRDIFMYRGDTPFCSEECREEQIEIDEAKEKNWKISASMKALRNKKKDSQKSATTSSSSSSPSKNQNYPYRAGTVVAA